MAHQSASNDGGEICGGRLMMRSLIMSPTCWSSASKIASSSLASDGSHDWQCFRSRAINCLTKSRPWNQHITSCCMHRSLNPLALPVMGTGARDPLDFQQFISFSALWNCSKSVMTICGYLSKHFTVYDSNCCSLVVATWILYSVSFLATWVCPRTASWPVQPFLQGSR